MGESSQVLEGKGVHYRASCRGHLPQCLLSLSSTYEGSWQVTHPEAEMSRKPPQGTGWCEEWSAKQGSGLP